MHGSRRRPEFDRLKGVLIALVVLGHNNLFSTAAPRVFTLLYNFHVASFLLIPFLYDAASFSKDRLGDRFVRYLVPHFVFFALACGAYYLLFVTGEPISAIEWVKSVMLAVLFSSESTYNHACGFRLFWFLPSLWTLVCLLTLYYKASPRGKAAVLFVAVCVHLLLGVLPADVLPWVPWGLPIVLFVLPVGLLAGLLWRRFKDTYLWLWVCAALFVACMCISWSLQSWIALAGEPVVYSITDPVNLVFHDIFLLCALFGLLGVATVLPDVFFRKLGLASLFVYLTHGFVWQTLLRTGTVHWIAYTVGGKVGPVLITYALTLAICLVLHDLLKKHEAVWSLVFPRNRANWWLPRLSGSSASGS